VVPALVDPAHRCGADRSQLACAAPLWLTALVAVPVLAWWGLFLVVVPYTTPVPEELPNPPE